MIDPTTRNVINELATELLSESDALLSGPDEGDLEAIANSIGAIHRKLEAIVQGRNEARGDA